METKRILVTWMRTASRWDLCEAQTHPVAFYGKRIAPSFQDLWELHGLHPKRITRRLCCIRSRIAGICVEHRARFIARQWLPAMAAVAAQHLGMRSRRSDAANPSRINTLILRLLSKDGAIVCGRPAGCKAAAANISWVNENLSMPMIS